MSFTSSFNILDLSGRLGNTELSNVDVLPPASVTNPNKGSTPDWHKSAVVLNAHGSSIMEIAASLNKPVKVINEVLRSDWAKAELIKVTGEYSVGAAEEKQLKSCAMEAVMVLQTLMHTAASDAVRLNAAKEVLDRTLGKTAQRIHHSGQSAFVDAKEEIDALKAELKLKN